MWTSFCAFLRFFVCETLFCACYIVRTTIFCLLKGCENMKIPTINHGKLKNMGNKNELLKRGLSFFFAFMLCAVSFSESIALGEAIQESEEVYVEVEQNKEEESLPIDDAPLEEAVQAEVVEPEPLNDVQDVPVQETQVWTEEPVPADNDDKGEEDSALQAEEAAQEEEQTQNSSGKLSVSVSTGQWFIFADQEDLSFETTIRGGVEPFRVSYEMYWDDWLVMTTEGYSERVLHSPGEPGEYKLVMNVTDDDGNTASDACSVLVAVREEETALEWEQTMQHVELTGDYCEDLVAVASTQIGYRESTRNYIIDDRGERKGYTRYGHKYGLPYEDWCAMFVSFCMYYSDIPQEDMPTEVHCGRWRDALNERDLYVTSSQDYTPEVGDLVFFHYEGIEGCAADVPNHVGIISDMHEDGDAFVLDVIEGNYEDAVTENRYSTYDAAIVGYGLTSKAKEIVEEETESEADGDLDGQDLNADLETEDDWLAAVGNLEFTGNWAQDLLAVAESQLGYHASETNFILDDAGEVQRYTRYGQWAGDPYGEWNCSFAAFCMNYAGIRDVPVGTDADEWIDELTKRDMYHDVSDSERPAAGDFLFTCDDGDEWKVSLVEDVSDDGVTVIMGDADGAVARVSVGWDDQMLGFGHPVSSVTDESGRVVVTGILPEDIQLRITQITEEDDLFKERQRLLQEKLAAGYDPYVVNLEEETVSIMLSAELIKNGEVIQPCKDVTVLTRIEGEVFGECDRVRYMLFDSVDPVLQDTGVWPQGSAESTEADTEEAEPFAETEPEVIVSEAVEVEYTGELSDLMLAAVRSDQLRMRRSASDDGIIVTVEYGMGAEIPADAQLQTKRIYQEEETYQECFDQTQDWIEDAKVQEQISELQAAQAEFLEEVQAESSETEQEDAEVLAKIISQPEIEEESEDSKHQIGDLMLYDISFILDERELEPHDVVSVSFDVDGEADNSQNCLLVVHYTDETIEAPEDQMLNVDSDGQMRIAFTTESFSQYAVIVTQGNGSNIQVWFDGSDGLGTANSLYKNATNVQGAENGQTIRSGARIRLPDSAGNNTKYTLNGWYDIVHDQYYAPGQEITITDNTVFYAEWVQTNYNVGPSSGSSVVTNQPDISNFVKTEVFDYNEIFNITHGAAVSGNVFNWRNGSLQRGHTEGMTWVSSETWSDTRNQANGGDFLFTNWYYNKWGQKWLGFPSNCVSNRNRYDNDRLTQGIIGSRDEQLMQDLFGAGNIPGKVSLGQGDWLYQYDNNTASDRYGYYYYDSEKNAADYNQQQQRFYVYNGTQLIQGDNGLDNGQSNKSFMPFEGGTQTVYKGSGQTNFWFGMHSTIDFFLPDNSGSGGNRAIGNKPMEFYFSGDDDVWVFVDDQLVLDLGGIHQRRAGSINFSDGTVRIQSTDANGNPTGAVTTTALPQIAAGDHKLHFYYLERGSSWSNASIYFNIAPRYTLEIDKEDGETHARLENAQFSVYMDENCTIPAVLWDDEASSHQSGTSKNTFTTDSNGRIHCYGLYANSRYYLKETGSPSGYPSIAEKTFIVRLDQYGTATLENDGDALATLTQNDATKLIGLKIDNNKPPFTQIKVQKNWYSEEGEVLTDNLPEKVIVKLYRAVFESESQPEPEPEPEPNPEPLPKIPVTISTQYFNIYADGHGANQDTAPIKAGDLSRSAIVTKGGTVTLSLNTDVNAGIYSVMVNGRVVQPDAGTAQNPSVTQTQIGGSWGNYQPTKANYTIEPVNEATRIVITLIGYLKYKDPSHPETNIGSVDASMSVVVNVTDPPENPGTGSSPGTGGGSGTGGGTTQPIVIPSEKPGHAEPAAFEDGTPVPPFELNASNNWGADWDGWENLPTTVEKDGKTYTCYYYVEEDPRIPGFSTSYSGNGTMNGTVTVSNVQEEIEIPVTKSWIGGNGSIDAVTVKLLENGQWYDNKTIVLSAPEWRGKFTDLPRTIGNRLADYSVEEIVPEGYVSRIEEEDGAFSIINTLLEVRIRKVDKDTEETLANAVFSIYSELLQNGEVNPQKKVPVYLTNDFSQNPVENFSTNSNGEVTVYGLLPGTYYLREESAPAGYGLIPTVLTFVVGGDGSTTIEVPAGTDAYGNDSGTIVVKDEKLVDLIFTKVDSVKGTVDPEGLLAGAVFSLYRDAGVSEDSVVLAYPSPNLSGTRVTVFSSGQDGKVHIYGLEPGVYYLKEVKAPVGYYLIENPIRIELGRNGSITSAQEITINEAGDEVPVSDGSSHVELISSSLNMIVENNPLYSLPSSGGMGTYLFTFSGAAIVAIALLLYLFRRREGGYVKEMMNK